VDSAVLESVLFDGPTTVISVSKRRTFTGAVRRAIQVRDRHCQHPSGCDVPAEDCDVDHTVPYTAGGPTSQFNGRLQCPSQNRDADKHDHGAIPLPPRPITRLDELRARIRWRILHSQTDDEDDDEQAG
jgi:5-methylcytosine-specific restriction endonuclease McrA